MPSKTSAHRNITKHIDTCYHFIRDCVKHGRVIIEHVKVEDQLAGILSKALGRVKFGELSARIGIKKAWDKKKIKEENVEVIFPLGAWLVCVAQLWRARESTQHTHKVHTQ